MCGRPSLLTAGRRSSVLMTALPFASCPVMMRLTSIAMSILLRRPFARVRILPRRSAVLFVGYGERGTDRQPALRPDPAASAGEKGSLGDGRDHPGPAGPRRAGGRALLAEPIRGIGPFGRSKALGGALSRL